MPVNIPAQTFSCQNCGWKKTLLNISDVRMEGVNWFDSCPECGLRKIESRKPTTTEKLYAKMASFKS